MALALNRYQHGQVSSLLLLEALLPMGEDYLQQVLLLCDGKAPAGAQKLIVAASLRERMKS